MIEFNRVELHYHYDEFAVLKDLTFTLNDGINTILCDTQSGKSSVCKLLTKQFKPTKGQILLDGQDICGITNKALGTLYLPARPVFFENRSVKYNTVYPLKVRKANKAEREKRFKEISKLVDLPPADTKIKKLSAKERSRVAVARGLCVERKIVLLDDFCESKEEIFTVKKLFGNALTVVLTSKPELACGNTIVLDGGNTVYCGTAEKAAETVNNLSWISDILRSE